MTQKPSAVSSVPSSPPAATGSPAASPWRALSVLLAGAFMAVLDTFIVLVAAPAVRTELHASAADLQLILAGYQLTYAVALITGARLGDLLGRKRMFMTGTALFTLASAACAVAPGPGALTAARMAQGLTAALMFPQVLTMIQVLVPAPGRPRAFGALGAVIGLSGAAGQLLGGVLVAAHPFGSAWRPVFWVNVPIGLVTLALAARYVPESRAEGARRLDLPGAAALTVALFLLVVPLIEGREAGRPLWTWLGLAAAAAALAVFVAVERRVEARGGAPLVRPGLLRSRPFALGMSLVVLAYAGINSYFLVLSLTLQDGLGMSALGSALCYVPFAAAFFATNLAAGRTSGSGTGALRCGALVAAAGFGATVAVAACSDGGPRAWQLALALVPVGVGNGLLVPPLLGAVLSRVGPADTGTASGVLSTGQQVGGALGVAVAGALYFGARNGSGPAAYGHALAVATVFHVVLMVVLAGLLGRLRR
ncbi:MFS transporter [Streptomyces albireticuli]|uniref:MFS transporter n=1 Tax=Streptomyces albireticuli TaxID=1940 RepID=UPI000B4455D8|nr:MFS transporter [Streptomyces albireticuli]